MRSARAWIVSADRKRVKTYDRRDFTDTVAHYSRYVWDRQRVLTFEGAPKIETGGFLGWEFEISTPTGITGSSWNFQNSRPVLHASYEAIPSPGGNLIWHASSTRLEQPASGSSPGAMRWEMSRLRPFSLGRPTGFLLNPLAISTRCLPTSQAAGGDRSWTREARQVAEIIDPQIEAGGAVEKRAGELASGRIARWDRIRAVAEFVQRDIVYLSITLDKDYLAGCRPHRASQVLRDRYGDCKDKATLMISMLRAIGENAHPVLLTAGDPSAVAFDWPSLEFNHMIVAMTADRQGSSRLAGGGRGAFGQTGHIRPNRSGNAPGGFEPGGSRRPCSGRRPRKGKPGASAQFRSGLQRARPACIGPARRSRRPASRPRGKPPRAGRRRNSLSSAQIGVGEFRQPAPGSNSRRRALGRIISLVRGMGFVRARLPGAPAFQSRR